MASAISGGRVSVKDLEPYKRSYKLTKRFRGYLVKNPDHDTSLANQLMEINSPHVFSKINEES